MPLPKANLSILTSMSNTKPTPSPYEAVLAITLALVVVYYYFFPDDLRWLVGTMIFALLCLLSAKVASGVAFIWDKVTVGLGEVMSRVLFTVVFFVLLTPLALLSRLFRKDQFYKSTDRESYFIERDHPYGADDIQHP